MTMVALQENEERDSERAIGLPADEQEAQEQKREAARKKLFREESKKKAQEILLQAEHIVGKNERFIYNKFGAVQNMRALIRAKLDVGAADTMNEMEFERFWASHDMDTEDGF